MGPYVPLTYTYPILYLADVFSTKYDVFCMRIRWWGALYCVMYNTVITVIRFGCSQIIISCLCICDELREIPVHVFHGNVVGERQVVSVREAVGTWGRTEWKISIHSACSTPTLFSSFSFHYNASVLFWSHAHERVHSCFIILVCTAERRGCSSWCVKYMWSVTPAMTQCLNNCFVEFATPWEYGGGEVVVYKREKKAWVGVTGLEMTWCGG